MIFLKNYGWDIVNVTPEMAAEILENNPINRRVMKSKVSGYVQQMKNGDWKTNGETIIMDNHGALLNGQHRLHAVMVSGVSVEMMFIHGIKRDAFDTIDSGQARTPTDVLSINAEWSRKDASSATAAARTNIKMRNSGVLNAQCLGQLTPHAVADEVLHDDGYRNSVDFIGGLNNSLLLGIGRAVFLHKRMSEISPGFTDDWFTGLITGAELSDTDPRLIARNMFMRNASQTISKMTLDTKTYIILKAWFCALNGEIITERSLKKAGPETISFIRNGGDSTPQLLKVV